MSNLFAYLGYWVNIAAPIALVTLIVNMFVSGIGTDFEQYALLTVTTALVATSRRKTTFTYNPTFFKDKAKF